MIDMEKKAILNLTVRAVDEALAELDVGLCNSEWIYLSEILEVLITLDVCS